MEELVVIVSVEVPGPVIVDGAKLQLALLGNPEHERATESLNPPTTAKLIVELAELPGATMVGKNGFAVKSKSGVAGAALLISVITPALRLLTSTTISTFLSPLKSAVRT